MSHCNGAGDRNATYQWLQVMLPEARAQATRLIEDLRRITSICARLSEEMDFSFLYDRYRRLLSIGFDVGNNQLHSACYDLLASESRTAAFIAIAKEDIRQETWFHLGRSHTRERGLKVLLSWTGTMFEYLMPSVWMRTYPNTLLERSHSAAVRLQQAYTAGKGIPWGISESAYSKTDSEGNYQYHAFGLPSIALHKPEFKALVISPYSSLLALPIDAAGTMQNLRTMAGQGWFGPYGFYEAADFTSSRVLSWRRRYELVRCWMAHHQGMSLLSLANFLNDGVVQRWFHNDRRVQATELLLHEKPAAQVRPRRKLYKTAA
jgi:cyclic beta-1,2-glucan synthetase